MRKLLLVLCCVIYLPLAMANLAKDNGIPDLPKQHCPDGTGMCFDGALMITGIPQTANLLMKCDKYDDAGKQLNPSGQPLQYVFNNDNQDKLYYISAFELNNNGTPIGEANLEGCVIQDLNASNQLVVSINNIKTISSFAADQAPMTLFIGMFIGGGTNIVPGPSYILKPSTANPAASGYSYTVPTYPNPPHQFYLISLQQQTFNDGILMINNLPVDANATTIDLTCTDQTGKTYPPLTAPTSSPTFSYATLHDAVAPNQPNVNVNYSSCALSYATVAQPTVSIPLGSLTISNISSNCAQHWCGTVTNIQTASSSNYNLSPTPTYSGVCADGSSTNPPCSEGTVNVQEDGVLTLNGLPADAQATTVALTCTADSGKTYPPLTASVNSPIFSYATLHDAVAPNQPTVSVHYTNCNVSYVTQAQPTVSIPLGSFTLSNLDANCNQHWCATIGDIQTAQRSAYNLYSTPLYSGICADGSSSNPPCSEGELNVQTEQDGQLNIVGDDQGKPPATMLPFVMSCISDETHASAFLRGNSGTQGLIYNLQDISSQLSNATSVSCIVMNRQYDNMATITLGSLGHNCQTPNAGKWCATLTIARNPLTGSAVTVPIGTPVTGQWCENTTEPCDQWNLIFHGIGLH